MGGLFSTLSKQLLGNFLLSSGLPAVAFVLGFQALVAPRLPDTWHLLEAPEALETEWKTALAAVAVLVVATALTALNGPIIRLFEGYPLEGSWLGRKLAEKHRSRAREAEVWWLGVRSILRGHDRLSADAKEAAGIDAAAVDALDERWNEVGQDLVALYPASGRALPTRLGNVIRAFEDYSQDEYGIYGVTTWPRLAAVIDDGYARQIADTKHPFDLMLNAAVVSGGLGLLTLVTGLARPEEVGRTAGPWLVWGGGIALLLLLAWGFYLLALPRAAAWGDTVKGAFDLHRWKLLEALGFGEPPKTMEDERELWRRIGGHMVFGRMTTYEPLVYADGHDEREEEPRWIRALRALVN
jgi:hypothetical protein